MVSKVRGINRTFDRITDLIAKEADRLSEVWYVHCDGQHFIERLEKVVQDRFKPAKSYFNKARGCIGSHSGPGLFGIAYIL